MNDKLAIVFHIGTISTDIVKSIPLNLPKIIYTPPKAVFFYIITLCIIFLYIFSWNNPRLGSVLFSYNGWKMIWPNDKIICKIKQSTRLQIWSRSYSIVQHSEKWMRRVKLMKSKLMTRTQQQKMMMWRRAPTQQARHVCSYRSVGSGQIFCSLS